MGVAEVGGRFGIPEVGGNPDALRGAAADCRAIAAGFAQVDGMMRAAGQPEGWSGVAAKSFSGRIATEAGVIQTGVDAFADGARAFAELADELEALRTAIRRLAEDAERATADERRESSAAVRAESDATIARGRSLTAGMAASQAEIAADPSAAGHREEEARQRQLANTAGQEAEARRGAATRRGEELREAQATARHKTERYERLGRDAAAVFTAMAAVAPHINTVWGAPIASVGNPGAPTQVVPVLPRASAGPNRRRESGGTFDWDAFLDQLRPDPSDQRQSALWLAATTSQVGLDATQHKLNGLAAALRRGAITRVEFELRVSSLLQATFSGGLTLTRFERSSIKRSVEISNLTRLARARRLGTLARRLPYISALTSFGLSSVDEWSNPDSRRLSTGERVGRTAGVAGYGTAASAAGAAFATVLVDIGTSAAAGAGAGSVVPGGGTAAGLVIGALGGATGGGIALGWEAPRHVVGDAGQAIGGVVEDTFALPGKALHEVSRAQVG